MTVGEFIEIEELEQKRKEINACIRRCQRYGNIKDEEILREKYLKPAKERINILKTR